MLNRSIFSPKTLDFYQYSEYTQNNRCQFAATPMIRQKFQGGEFYAKSTCKYGTGRMDLWNSPIKQLWSIVRTAAMHVANVAWITSVPGALFCPINSSPYAGLPHHEKYLAPF